ncbi:MULTISPECIES: TolC family protein [unclassified Brenneria]|uniref:TolC family protein n=1 Tax=unclassified Brenneria TaxID=2634434 RepID=UPI0029C3C071|nr:MULTISPECIES: TolC family protein [unclassified Brenneria]MDX5627833.1 TolC family protein [Brenneria sp. L3-3Z]MDX5695076.1 TolC family protein [Brenneria sp. L4-2C]MEE3660459.1 TolC family protein [Brenneria sp. g21c3]
MSLSKRPSPGWLAMLLWLPAVSFAADLDLNQALQAAERYSAELSANNHQIRSLQNMADSATQLPDPQLKFGVENLPLGGNNGGRLTREGMTMQRIGIMQTYVSSSKRENKAQTFRVEADSLRSNREAIRARLQRETAQAWLELALSQQSLQEVKSLVNESRRQIPLQKAGVASGGEASNVLDARLTLAAMQDKLADAERDVQIARARMVQLTGIPDINIRGALPRFERLPASPDELSKTIHLHPEMQLAQRESELALARSAQSSVAAIPDVGVELYYAKRGDDYDDMAGVMVTVDLPLFKSKRQDKDYAADVARTQEARDNVLLTGREHQAQLATLIAQYQAAQSRWQRQKNEVLPLQRQRIKLIQTQYQSGVSDLAAVLEARRSLLESQIDAQTTAREMAQFWAAIRYLTPQGNPLQ